MAMYIQLLCGRSVWLTVRVVFRWIPLAWTATLFFRGTVLWVPMIRPTSIRLSRCWLVWTGCRVGLPANASRICLFISSPSRRARLDSALCRLRTRGPSARPCENVSSRLISVVV